MRLKWKPCYAGGTNRILGYIDDNVTPSMYGLCAYATPETTLTIDDNQVIIPSSQCTARLYNDQLVVSNDSTKISFKHYISIANSNGRGLPSNIGIPEIYTRIKIKKIL